MLMEHVVMVKVGQQANAHCFHLSVCLLPPGVRAADSRVAQTDAEAPASQMMLGTCQRVAAPHQRQPGRCKAASPASSLAPDAPPALRGAARPAVAPSPHRTVVVPPRYRLYLQVRQAEMEGEYLEARRQLARTREKNMQVGGGCAWCRGGDGRGAGPPCRPSSSPAGVCSQPDGSWPTRPGMRGWLLPAVHCCAAVDAVALAQVVCPAPPPPRLPAMQLLKKLSEVREAAEKGEPLPLTPKGAASGTMTTPRAAPSADSAGDVGQASQPMRKGLIRIPGL